jgi:hypothetical protein
MKLFWGLTPKHINFRGRGSAAKTSPKIQIVVPFWYTLEPMNYNFILSASIFALAASAFGADTGKYWAENRIVYNSNLPHDRDGLKDDVDYFPDEYLKEIAACGMNGIWMRVNWRSVAKTSFTSRPSDGERRLKKLRAISSKCRKNGLGLWIFGNEPARFRKGDELLNAHPELGGAYFPTHGSTMWCPSSEETLRYVEESVRDIFSHVPDLAGFVNIAYGESLTTCLDAHECCDIDNYGSLVCKRCTSKPLWEAYVKTSKAIMRGMRAAGSSAPYISWFYQPMGTEQRKQWVFDCAQNAPEGTTFMFNFESATIEEQLGKLHCGSDYWLAKSRPGTPFMMVAKAAHAGNTRLGAKIQTSVSHEMATLPYVPAPGLLYRKYKHMKRLGVKDVMQGWFFGGEPGLMLQAAGMLSRDDFLEDEEDFLNRLAKLTWGEDAEKVAAMWKDFSDAFSNYPLDTQVQYFGPYHAGITWNLHAYPVCENLARTWRPNEPPSADRIGQCLGSFSIWEAEQLSRAMAETANKKEIDETLNALAKRYSNNHARMMDIGVMRAFRLQLASAAEIFRFYRLRAEGIHASRRRGDKERAITSINAMAAAVKKERLRSLEMIELCKVDSRLGFHAEAAKRLYDQDSLSARLKTLDATLADLKHIRDEIAQGRPWPFSQRERTSALAKVGKGEFSSSELSWRAETAEDGSLVISGICSNNIDGITLMLSDAASIRSPVRCNISRPGTGSGFYIPQFDKGFCFGSAKPLDGGRWSFSIKSPRSAWGEDGILRPSWIALLSDTYLPMGKSKTLWPEGAPQARSIGLLWADGSILGRLSWPSEIDY